MSGHKKRDDATGVEVVAEQCEACGEPGCPGLVELLRLRREAYLRVFLLFEYYDWKPLDVN